jgi:hypothetical protein
MAKRRTTKAVKRSKPKQKPKRSRTAFNNALAMLHSEYDLTSQVATDLARTIADNYQLRADADEQIESMGLICRGGRNGAPYQNPAVSIRVKLSELIERQLARMDRYKRQITVEPLTLDDDQPAPAMTHREQPGAPV